MLENMEKITNRVIGHPEGWPNRPVLPVKRFNKAGKYTEFGIILAEDRLIVYKTNMHDFKTLDDLRKKDKKKYKSLENLLKDGWIVE